eukprot:4859463-Pyramimonas_sp.AAC.1
MRVVSTCASRASNETGASKPNGNMPSSLPRVVRIAGICPSPFREWSALREYALLLSARGPHCGNIPSSLPRVVRGAGVGTDRRSRRDDGGEGTRTTLEDTIRCVRSTNKQVGWSRVLRAPLPLLAQEDPCNQVMLDRLVGIGVRVEVRIGVGMNALVKQSEVMLGWSLRAAANSLRPESTTFAFALPATCLSSRLRHNGKRHDFDAVFEFRREPRSTPPQPRLQRFSLIVVVIIPFCARALGDNKGPASDPPRPLLAPGSGPPSLGRRVRGFFAARFPAPRGKRNVTCGSTRWTRGRGP